MSKVKQLFDKGLVTPPKWLPHNVMYETIMGSVAYGVSADTSDMDVYGFCMPKKEMVFPHLGGEIFGFIPEVERFDQWQQHHVVDPDECGEGRTHDLQIYSIVKYFKLCMDNNPNMIDSLFTPDNCVLTRTKIANMVRDKRRAFLHKGAWHTFKGYAYSQVHKMSGKDPKIGSKRQQLREQFGFDVKFGYHVVRLLNEVEQILSEGDLDLQRNNEQLKAIRRGEWTEEQIKDHFTSKEKELEHLYLESKLPWGPDKQAIKALLLECLEEHYGNLQAAVSVQGKVEQAIREIQTIVGKF
jgi:uncharacterized protein